MFGEVEKCNWNPGCVAEWVCLISVPYTALFLDYFADNMQDKNVAEWDTLSKEEQDKRLSEKPQMPA
jgi:hypothetical protein